MLAVDANAVVKKGVMSVMRPGFRQSGWSGWSAIDDVDMEKANGRGSFAIIPCSLRDSVVIDTFTEVGVTLLLSRTLTSPC
jgi:hypothetical protein